MNNPRQPQRLRGNSYLRELTRETRLSAKSLLYPIFIQENLANKSEIPSMPGQFRHNLTTLLEEVEACVKAGVGGCILFGIPAKKDHQGTGAWDENGIIQQGIREIRRNFPDFYVITDVCLCEYTTHGHCRVLVGDQVNGSATLEKLAQIAISHALAGCHMVAPSSMMDGQVSAIRGKLDETGFSGLPILSYSAKYASSFYGPFRQAADSAPSYGDRKSYQMDYHNRREALVETALDVEQGADIIMVKPALSYLDVIAQIKGEFSQPVCAYSVSGEYAMIKAGAAAGWLDEWQLMLETATSIFRAGADLLITYYAQELAIAINRGEIG